MGIEVAIAASVASAAVGAYGQMQGAAAARRAGAFSQGMANREAKILEHQAETARQLGDYSAWQFMDQFQESQDATTVAYLKNGVTLEGTALDVLAENAGQAEIQRQGILWNAELQSKQIADSAVLRRMEGQLAAMKGQQVAQAATGKAFGSLLSGAGRVGELYARG
tara:strand:+ start:347 stop:847 length:501 start_codon:yes stop_codon:yes gene_type:complete